MITENLSTLKIHKLTKEQYERELAAGRIDGNAMYLTPDEEIDLSPYATIEQLNAKANTVHSHNDIYYTEAEIDAKLLSKSDSTHNHDDKYDAKNSASTALDSAKSYTDTKVANLASATTVDTKISTHNTSTSAHNDIRDLITGLTTRLNTLANSDDTTLDQMSEVVAYIKNNKSLIDGITTSKVNVSDIVNNLTTNTTNKPLSAAQGVAIKGLIDALQEELDSHTHAIADVSGLQSALDGKADSSHGTHVTYSTTTPVMDGTASVGSASTVARSDHKHPTDTSRAAKTDFDSHTGNTTVHITAIERTNWNTAKTTAESAQTRADNAYTLAESKVDSLSDLGVTATATELNYMDGVTSNVQTQIDGKAPAIHTHPYGVCNSGDFTAAKTVTVSNFSLVEGARVLVKFAYENNASNPTLNVNSTGAKPIMKYGTTAAGTNEATTGWEAGAIVPFTYDGTNWVEDYWCNTTYNNASLGSGLGYCSTYSGTEMTVGLYNYKKAEGGVVSVEFVYDVPASATMNINSEGASEIYYKGAAIPKGLINGKDTATFIYYNTRYHLISIDRFLPAVSSLDNGKFLRVVDGVWTASTVPSAEGASF